MTISGVFHSVWSSATRRSDLAQVRGTADPAALHHCEMYRKSFPMTEIALPAYVLRNHLVAKWARAHSLFVDVRSGEELAVAIAAVIHPGRMIVHADGLSESQLRATINLTPGRVVLGSIKHIDILTTAVEHRKQGVFIQVVDGNAPTLALADGQYTPQGGFRLDSTELDRVVSAIVNSARLDLVGLYCSVGALAYDFVSYPAAIGQIITEMTHIRRQHGILLTRLGLGGGRAMPAGDWTDELPSLAGQIDESLDDACATMRFPRPIVVLSPGRAITERHAA